MDEVVRQIKEEGKLNVKEATLKTYDAKSSSAAAVGHENLTKPYIREAYLAELQAQGVTDELAAKAVRGAMKADKRQRNYETGEVLDVFVNWTAESENFRVVHKALTYNFTSFANSSLK